MLEGAGVALSTREVFASCAGGLEVGEPACDLAVVAAIVSSVRNVPLPDGAVAFGEIGLLGEIRTVPAGASRLREAAALGFTLAFLPAGNAGDAAAFPEIAARPIARLADFLKELDRGPAGK